MEHLVQGFQAFSTSTVVPSQEEQLQSLGGPSHELGGCQDSKVEELRIQAAKATPSFQMPDKPAFKFTPSVGSWLQSKPPQAEDAKEAPTYWTLWRTEEGKFYFHNEDTDKTAWDLPPGGVVYLDEDALSMFLEQDLRPGTEEILAWRRGWGQWCSPPPSAVIRDSRTERSFSYETSLEADSEVEEWLFGDAGDLDTNSLPDQNDLKSEAEASSTSTVVQLESPGGRGQQGGRTTDSDAGEAGVQVHPVCGVVAPEEAPSGGAYAGRGRQGDRHAAQGIQGVLVRRPRGGRFVVGLALRSGCVTGLHPVAPFQGCSWMCSSVIFC
ncbi:unnamed protein product [Effrenium voratum]|uniref:WW domain-containing protein n=1 Tax=Effrenium voratum TaxID=2562239 RepID=A0AA36IBF5_9DINO|nr:unnamed protein product [Effrenium voratum]